MDTFLDLQYQAKTEPPPGALLGIPLLESTWHQPWSEPVRQKIAPALAVALIASGLFAPVLTTQQFVDGIESRWHQPWSEPVRFKKGIPAYLQQTDSLQVPVQPPASKLIQWYAPLTEPVRIKPRLPTPEQPFFYFEPEPPIAMAMPWYGWLSEPVRYPAGLKVWLQRFFEAPPRLLPTPNVTATLAATEINTDVALFGIQVYNPITPVSPATTANVSIHEVKVEDSASASLRES